MVRAPVQRAERSAAGRETVTFDKLCHRCTPQEREALAWRLAEIRYRNTLRALLPELKRPAPPQPEKPT